MKIINLSFDEFTNKGISCFEERYYREAIAFFNKAIGKNNEAVVSYYYRALSKHALNRYEEAISDYDKVIALTSDYDEVYENRGRTRLVLKQYKLSIYDCAEAIRINPHNADAFEIRGDAKIKLGDDISGSEDIEKARQLRARWEVRGY